MKNLLNNQKGDTIVEVLLASAILALVLAGTFSLSSRASRLNQASYERSRASNLIQEQAELLRAAKGAGFSSGAWTIISGKATGSYYDCRDAANSPRPTDSDINDEEIFVLAPGGAAPDYIQVLDTAPDAVSTVDGLYSVFINKTNDAGTYQDFHIYACWPGIGDNPTQVAGLAVRLGE